MNYSFENFIKSLDKETKIALSVSALGLLLFFGVAFTLPFNSKLFSQLFPKPPSQATSPADWPQDGGNAQRTGYSSEEPVEPWTYLWSFNGPDAQGGLGEHFYDAPKEARTIMGGGKIYVPAGAKGLYGLNAQTGAQLWNFTTTSVNATPAYDPASSYLYAGGADGNLYKLNPDTKEVVATYNAGSPINKAILLVGNFVYAVSDDGKLHKVDSGSMSLAWATPYSADSTIATPPSYSASKDLIVYATDDLYVHAVNNSNGTQKWRVKPSPNIPYNDPATTATLTDTGTPTGNQFELGWPVIAEQHGIVFLRMQLKGDAIHQGPNNGKFANTNAENRTWLEQNPQYKNLFALNLDDGTEKFIPVVGYGTTEDFISGTNSNPYGVMGTQPVVKVLPDGKEVAYMIFRNGQSNPLTDFRWSGHMGEMVLDDTTVPGLVAGDLRFIKMARHHIYPDGSKGNCYTDIIDEETPLSIAGDTLFSAHWSASCSTKITDRSPQLGLTFSDPIKTTKHPPVTRSQAACSNFNPGTHWTTCNLSGAYPSAKFYDGPGFWIYWNVINPPASPVTTAMSIGFRPDYTYVSGGLMVVEGNGGELTVFKHSGATAQTTPPPSPSVPPSPSPSPTPTQGFTKGVAIIGDSLPDEYRADSNRGGTYGATTFNWMEILAQKRAINFGPWGSWGGARRSGYKYNWALSGMTTSGLISYNVGAGIAGQVTAGEVGYVLIQIGQDDFAPQLNSFFNDIYNGTISGAALEGRLDTMAGRVSSTIDTIRAAGDVKIVLSTAIEADIPRAPLPDAEKQAYLLAYPDPVKRQRVLDATIGYNQRLRSLAQARTIPVFEGSEYFLTTVPGRFDANGFFSVGGQLIDGKTRGNEPHHLLLEDNFLHPGTVASGQFANAMFIEMFNQHFQTNIAPLTDQEILQAAGIGSTPSPTPTPIPTIPGGGTQTPTPAPTPTNSPTPVPTATPTPVPCTLSTANWSTQQAAAGQEVTLNVTGTGLCSGKVVNFEIRRNVTGLPDESITFLTAPLSGTIATTQWTANWQNACIFPFTCDPEYFFKANLIGETTTIESIPKLLKVIQAPATPTNLISNGNFENDFTSWNKGTGSGWSITTTAYSGLKSAHFVTSANSNLIQNFSNLKTSTQYKVSFWVKLNSQTCPAGGCWGDFRASLGNNDWRNQFAGPDAVSVTDGNTTPGVWTKKSFTFTTGTVTSGELWLHNWGTYTFDVDIDEVKLFEVPQAPIPPAVSISADKTNLSSTADTVSFTSRADDDDGSVNYYFWDFGDGGKSNLPNPQYKYSSNGTYTVRLIVYDDSGQSSQAQTLITVADPNLPTLAISQAPSTSSSPAMNISGTAAGGTGATISKVEYSTDRGVYGTATGTTSWSFNLDLSKYSGPNKILITATDNQGNIASKTIDLTYQPASKVSVKNGSSGVTQNSSQVELYDKFEATFDLQDGMFSNPYLPYETNLAEGMKGPVEGKGVLVESTFTSPSGKTFKQPGFLYQPFQRVITTKQLVITGDPQWKIRFSPTEPGRWSYSISVTDASGNTVLTDNSKLTFNAIPQTSPLNHGFIKVSEKDKRYFEFSDGTPYIGVGPGPNINGKNSFVTDSEISQAGTGNSSLSRSWMSSSNVGGSSWAPWSGRIGNVSNSPGTSMTAEEAYGDGVFSLTLPQQGPGAQPQPAGNCFFYGFNGIDASVKPGTNYRVMLRVKSVGITGSGGFTFRPGVGWPDTCDKFAGQPLTVPYVQGTKDWHVITGSWNSGNKIKLGIGLLTLENVTGGKVYLDEVSIREDLGNGQFGPEVLSRSKFNVQNYFSQEASWNWDYGLDEFAKRGLYQKTVLQEKDDYSWGYISPHGFGYTLGGQMQKGYGASLKYQQYYWRYLTARLGYSRAIHSWEYVNEQEPSELWMAEELGKYVHSIDPNRHLATTSWWSSISTLWNDPKYPNVDYADSHAYVNNGQTGQQTTSWLGVTDPITSGSLTTDSALYTAAHSLDAYNKQSPGGTKPIIMGEAGITRSLVEAGGNDTDTKGVWLHQFIWPQLNHGGMYFIYWWDTTIKSNNLYPLFGIYRKFMEGSSSDTVNTKVPLTNGNYQDIQLTLPAGLRGWGQKDTVNGGAHFWMYDTGYTWVTPSGGTPVGGKTVSFDGLPAKNYTVEFWDTWTGDVTKQDLNHPGGVINLTVPSTIAQKDVAVKIYPQSTGYISSTPTSACTIDQASWKATTVEEGKPINLTAVTSGNCAGKQVNFVVRKNNTLSPDQDATNQPQPNPVSIVANTATTAWTADGWTNGCIFPLTCDPRYFFKANIAGDNATVDSSNPRLISVTKSTVVTPTPTPTTTPSVNPGDFNNNGTVEIDDYTIFVEGYGQSTSSLDARHKRADLNSNGTIDQDDYTRFVSVFGINYF